MTGRAPHPEEIKAAVRMKGLTMAELMARGGFNKSSGTRCLTRHLPGPRQLIADFLNRNPSEFWPADYHADGSPRTSRHARKATRRRGGSIAQKSSGALAA